MTFSKWTPEELAAFARAVHESYERELACTKIGASVPFRSRDQRPAPPSREQDQHIDPEMVALVGVRNALQDRRSGWRRLVDWLTGQGPWLRAMEGMVQEVMRMREEVSIRRALQTRAVVDAYDPPRRGQASVRPRRRGEGGNPE